MTNTIVLRPATMDDADLLLAWRNDPETRQASHNTVEIQKAEHIIWLKKLLSDPYRKLNIAEEDNLPVGSVRADFSDGIWELSWTVAPTARGRGVAKRMTALFARQFNEPIRAEVKADNIASARIAEHAGMKFESEIDGVLHYVRPALR